MRRGVAVAAIVVAVLIGGVAGALLGTPNLSGAQTGSETPPPDAPPAFDRFDGPQDGPRWHRGFGGGFKHHGLETAAEAIGISEEELAQALRDGQSVADVARSRNVDPQLVIDALVEQSRERITGWVNGTTRMQQQGPEPAPAPQ
jgi:hypothetical protein